MIHLNLFIFSLIIVSKDNKKIGRVEYRDLKKIVNEMLPEFDTVLSGELRTTLHTFRNPINFVV